MFKIEDHYQLVAVKFVEDLKKSKAAPYLQYIKLNNNILAAAIENATIDLKRMTDFHLDGTLPNAYKYAGFHAKWIAKDKPIYIEAGIKNMPEFLYKINSLFAFYVFDSFLNFGIDDKFFEQLVYKFTFRETRGETLSFIAEILANVK